MDPLDDYPKKKQLIMDNLAGGLKDNGKKKYSSEVVYDDKEFQICTAGLKFKSGHIFFIRVWNNQDFTRLSRLTKYAFQEQGFLELKKRRDNCNEKFILFSKSTILTNKKLPSKKEGYVNGVQYMTTSS